MKCQKIITALFAISIFFSFIDNARPSLKDFKDGTDKSGTERSSSSDNSSGSDEGCFEDMIGDCLGQIFEAIGEMWLAHNLSAYYSSYPYEHPQISNFINLLPVFTKDKKSDNPVENKAEPEVEQGYKAEESGPLDDLAQLKPLPEFDHTYYLNADIGGQWARDDGSGAFVNMSGKIFRILGPECEYKRVIDKEDHLDYLALGINLSIIQTNYFSPDFYIQYASMKGIVDLDGFAFGLIAHSYPVKPLHLMFRIGKQSYTKHETEDIYRDISFIDLEGRIGVIFYRFEIFAGYRHIETDYAELGGPICGIRVWF